jgi:hypothetical protein
MTTLQIDRPTYMTSSDQEETVQRLSTYSWERCVTLTTKRSEEHPELFEYLHNFIRRIDGVQKTRCGYWLSLSQNNQDLTIKPYPQSFYSRIHIHGVLSNVSNLTNEQIRSCWKSLPKPWKQPDSDLIINRRFSLGHVKVVHFDGDHKWFRYCLNQTRRGEVYTNVQDLRV